jgi:hypothetical protein
MPRKRGYFQRVKTTLAVPLEDALLLVDTLLDECEQALLGPPSLAFEKAT